MKLEDIKREIAHLPHVTKVWVKDNLVFIHKVKGAIEHELKQDEEKTVKPSKKIKDGAE